MFGSTKKLQNRFAAVLTVRTVQSDRTGPEVSVTLKLTERLQNFGRRNPSRRQKTLMSPPATVATCRSAKSGGHQ
jgi:hypothetical protein